MKRLFPILLAAAAVVQADSALAVAVRGRDSAALKHLIAAKADLNEPATDGSTALHWAAHLDDTGTAEQLIRGGANVKALNRYGIAPLTLAATNGSAAMIRLLLRAGADPNTTTPEGETVLMTAARTGRTDAVAALLENGAAVDAKENWRGQTALMWAASEGHTDVVRHLIAAGADVRQPSTSGFSAFLFAVRDGRAGVVRALLDAGANPNEDLAPRIKRTTGANEFGATEGGTSALHIAVANGHFELAAMLLDAGADPNASGPGWTPLHSVSWVRRPGYGSNDPAPPGSGNMDSTEFVRKLVKKGANINARMTRRSPAGLSALNMVGATPFLMAARTADAPLMRLLVELGADPKLPNADNSTPLMVAAGLGTRSPGEDAGTEEEVLEAVKAALEFGNDPNAVDNNGETAMHGAAYKHLAKVVGLLAESGARVDAWNRPNKSGWTPLRIAAGVNRTGNFRSSAPTAEAIRKVMAAAGVPTDLVAAR